MILLYNFLSEMKPRIAKGLLQRIPREIEAYRKVPRPQLKESFEHLFDAYLNLIVSGDTRDLTTIFQYIVRLRIGQQVPMGATLEAMARFLPVTRALMQEEFRHLQGDGRTLFNKAYEKIELTFATGISHYTEIHLGYLAKREKITDGQFAHDSNYSADASRYIVLRG